MTPLSIYLSQFVVPILLVVGLVWRWSKRTSTRRALARKELQQKVQERRKTEHAEIFAQHEVRLAGICADGALARDSLRRRYASFKIACQPPPDYSSYEQPTWLRLGGRAGVTGLTAGTTSKRTTVRKPRRSRRTSPAESVVEPVALAAQRVLPETGSTVGIDTALPLAPYEQ